MLKIQFYYHRNRVHFDQINAALVSIQGKKKREEMQYNQTQTFQ